MPTTKEERKKNENGDLGNADHRLGLFPGDLVKVLRQHQDLFAGLPERQDVCVQFVQPGDKGMEPWKQERLCEKIGRLHRPLQERGFDECDDVPVRPVSCSDLLKCGRQFFCLCFDSRETAFVLVDPFAQGKLLRPVDARILVKHAFQFVDVGMHGSGFLVRLLRAVQKVVFLVAPELE